MKRIPTVPGHLEWPVAAACMILGTAVLVIALLVGLSGGL